MKPVKPMQPPQAIEPDAHLRTALRHAPDAALQAPPELGAQIVAAAYRAAAEAPAPAVQAPKPARASWLWGSTWRLGASGAFASVLMAGVIGLLWRGEAPGPAAEEVAPAAAAPLVQPAAAPSAEPPTAAAAPVDPQPQPRPQPTLPAARPLPARPATTDAPHLPALEAKLPPAPPPIMEKTQADATEPLPRPLAAAAPAAELAVPARAADSPASRLSLSGSRVATEATSAAGASDRLGAALAPAPAQMRQAAVAASPLPWLSASAEAGSAWLAGAPLAADSTGLQALQRHTAGHWQGTSAAQPDAAEALVEWRQGDRLLSRLWLVEHGALWCPVSANPAACQLAPLSAQALAELKEKLPR